MGPLAGVRVIEMKGIGPAPYAGMLLADMGAEVIVVERSKTPGGIAAPSAKDPHLRGKKSVVINVKSEDGLKTLFSLIDKADIFIEGYRPGVAERLGFGPDECLKKNKKIIYGRMTGWGQTGPLSQAAGHDINYISLTGALAAIGGANKPSIPLNLIGDYAGGSLFLAIGILAALYEAKSSGMGQVIDAAMTDGSASLMTMFHGMSAMGFWSTQRESNLLDGAAHFYDTYETKDGKYVSIGSIESQFYALLIEKASLDPELFSAQHDINQWPVLKDQLAKVMLMKTRDEWCKIMEGSDVCFAPVLNYEEAPSHPHNIARETYINIEGVVQPAPAPKFSRSVCSRPQSPPGEGKDTDEVLLSIGLTEEKINALKNTGAVS